MARYNQNLAVLPFRVGERVDVLLVAGGEGWRLPGGAMQKGLTQHASAALEARRETGLSGRIYKRPLRQARGDERVIIFPMLVVNGAAEATDGASGECQWFPLQRAADLLGHSLKPALDDFSRRIGVG